MKGIHGLLLAIGLGIAGALFNYAYLANKLPDVESVSFVAISLDAEVAPGERLGEDCLVRVDVPQRHVGNLKDVAVFYSDRQTVIGSRVWRPLIGGSLLLRQDLKTPPQELKLSQEEGVIWIPVDTRSLVPSLIVPGDQVSFLISRSRVGAPTLASGDEAGGAEQPFPDPMLQPTGPIETVGPFTVVSLGNRLGSADVLRSAKMPQVQENVVGIRVRFDDQGNLMPDVQRLIDLLDAINNRPVGIVLHGREKKSN